MRKCLDKILLLALCFQTTFQRIWVREKGKCVMLLLCPFLSPSLPSDLTNSSERLHRKNIGNRGLFHDMIPLKLRSEIPHWKNAFAFFYDSKRMPFQPQPRDLMVCHCNFYKKKSLIHGSWHFVAMLSKSFEFHFRSLKNRHKKH